MVPKPASIEAPSVPFDLVIHAGRVVCPATGLDGPGAVAIVGGRIAAAGPGVGGPAREELRLPDALLLPGLVDLHAHPARGESRYGVDPDVHLLPFGTTTVLAQGEAGALNLARYLDVVIARSLTRVRLAVNLSRRGEATPGGELRGPRGRRRRGLRGAPCGRPRGTASRAIWGIAVNLSRQTCGRTDPRAVMAEGLAAANETGLPLLFGPRRDDDWALKEQLALLRPGDVVTYCFSDCPEGLLADGRVRDEVWAARERGIRFDVGHGMGSFSFRVAEPAIAAGLSPGRHLDGPVPAAPRALAAPRPAADALEAPRGGHDGARRLPAGDGAPGGDPRARRRGGHARARGVRGPGGARLESRRAAPPRHERGGAARAASGSPS